MPTQGSNRGRGRWRQRPDREADRRRAQARARQELEDQSFDPAPPTDEDWTVEDGDKLRRLRPPEPVGDALASFLGRKGMGERLASTRLLERWEEIVGADVAQHAQPQRLDRGTLHLVVESAAWASQLQWMEQALVDKVNEAAGEVVVRRVRMIVAGA